MVQFSAQRAVEKRDLLMENHRDKTSHILIEIIATQEKVPKTADRHICEGIEFVK
jgi:hypothetical protein